MDDWGYVQPAAVPQTVYVYHDDDAAGAVMIGSVIGFTIGLAFALLLQTARVLIWLAVHGTPLVVWLVAAGTRALHDAAAGRLVGEPAAAASRRRDALAIGGSR